MKKITKTKLLKIKNDYDILRYDEKIDRYKKLNNSMKYGVCNENEFKEIWGYSFSEIEGFDKLDEENKKCATIGILNLVNHCGMDSRSDYLVYKIIVDMKYNQFIMYHLDGYSYVSKSGVIG